MIYNRQIQPSTSAITVAQRVLISLAWLSVIVVLGVLVWSANRGFDPTDESYALLYYRYPVEYPGSVSNFYLLVNKFFSPATTGILTYRFLAYGVAVLGTTLFGLGFTSWLRAEMRFSTQYPAPWFISSVFVLPWLLTAALLTFSISPRAFSYNGINTLFALSSVAALLTAIKRPALAERSSSRRWLWLVLCGVPVGLQVFIKISTAAVLLGTLGLVMLVVLWERGWQTVLGNWVLLGVGFGLGILLYFGLIQPPQIWWSLYQAEVKSLMQGQYSMGSLLSIYMDSLLHNLHLLAYPWGPVLGVVATGVYWQTQRVAIASMDKRKWFAVLFLCVGFLLYYGWKRQWYASTHINGKQTLAVLTALLLLAVIPGVAGLFRNRDVWRRWWHTRQMRRILAVGGLLIVMPLVMSVGTVNDLSINILCDLTTWFAAIVLVLLWLPIPVRLFAWVPLMLSLPLLYAAEQTLWGTLQTPYMLTGPMHAESEPLAFPGMRQPIRVNISVHQMITGIKGLLGQGGFQYGDPIIALYDMPGLVYASGGVSPAQPWFFSGRDARNCQVLDRTKLPLQRAYLLINEPPSAQFITCLAEHTGHRFPADYVLLGTVPNAYTANNFGWRSHQRVVAVYRPR